MERFFSQEIAPLPAATLIAVALICTVTDLWKGKIYNIITYTAMVLGLVIGVWQHGFAGFTQAAGGFAIGFFPAFLLFALGGMGGGDVKLLGAIGALAGPVPTTQIMVVAFLVGGFFALVKLAWKGVFWLTIWRTLRYLAGLIIPGVKRTSLTGEKPIEVRFGLAICVAVLVVLFSLHMGGIDALWRSA